VRDCRAKQVNSASRRNTTIWQHLAKSVAQWLPNSGRCQLSIRTRSANSREPRPARVCGRAPVCHVRIAVTMDPFFAMVCARSLGVAYSENAQAFASPPGSNPGARRIVFAPRFGRKRLRARLSELSEIAVRWSCSKASCRSVGVDHDMFSCRVNRIGAAACDCRAAKPLAEGKPTLNPVRPGRSHPLASRADVANCGGFRNDIARRGRIGSYFMARVDRRRAADSAAHPHRCDRLCQLRPRVIRTDPPAHSLFLPKAITRLSMRKAFSVQIFYVGDCTEARGPATYDHQPQLSDLRPEVLAFSAGRGFNRKYRSV